VGDAEPRWGRVVLKLSGEAFASSSSVDTIDGEIVDRIAGELTARLGAAELLWSRVSREPYATIALRPGVARPGLETRRPGVVRAGTWTDTGWPATMESAVRSGRTAAARALDRARDSVMT